MKRFLIPVLILFLAAAPVSGQEDSPIDAALYAVGSLSASNVYLSYLVLGTVADAYALGLYNESIAVGIASETMYVNSNALESIRLLKEGGTLLDEDLTVLIQISQVYELLNREAEALIRFISDVNDTGEAFQSYRDQAWNAISRLLGLDS